MRTLIVTLLVVFILLKVYILYNYSIVDDYPDDILNKKYFLTFGAGGKTYHDAVRRLVKQAIRLDMFDYVTGYTENDLKKYPEFWNKHSKFIQSNKRGYGYWIWKSYLIMKTLEQMNDNDILVYADCGCEINSKKRKTMYNYFKTVQKDLIIGTETGLPEKNWTKMDLILYLNMNDNKYTNTSQHQASTICILKCKKTVDLVKEWYEIACNYHLIDDSPSINPNYDTFQEHRHDQSIFSLLTKKYNIYSKSKLSSVIKINRNRSGTSNSDNLFYNFMCVLYNVYCDV